MEDLKAYSIRMPKDLWKFLKKAINGARECP